MDDDSSLNEFNEIVDELIEEGLLIRDGGAHGAAKQCFTEGYESLSPKQKQLTTDTFALLAEEILLCRKLR